MKVSVNAKKPKTYAFDEAARAKALELTLLA
jgi:hypothetical protein